MRSGRPGQCRPLGAGTRLTAGAKEFTLALGLAPPSVHRVGSETPNVGVGALLVYVRRRIRWGWGLLSDGVTVATTRHPGPLVQGLRRIASHNGDPIPTKARLGPGDPYWVAPVRTHASSTLSSNGKMISQSSTELLNDGELLVRASLVEDVCVRSGPATKALGRGGRRVSPPHQVGGRPDRRTGFGRWEQRQRLRHGRRPHRAGERILARPRLGKLIQRGPQRRRDDRFAL